MIKVNGYLIESGTFGDGTLKCGVVPDNYIFGYPKVQEILWAYDNDTELFTLCCIVDYIRDNYPWSGPITLNLPYIPHARQDRNVSNRLFTLKTFAKIVNSMNFKKVRVLDPHSDVSTALIDRIDVNFPYGLYDRTVLSEAIMFPDAGAAKKYGDIIDFGDKSIIIGNKHRNKEGRIESYELMNLQKGIKSVAIIDDICSYGGTFVAAAKALREKGVEEVILIISHCENNILKGEVFDNIDEVFTTDSICTVEHPKLRVKKLYRS